MINNNQKVKNEEKMNFLSQKIHICDLTLLTQKAKNKS